MRPSYAPRKLGLDALERAFYAAETLAQVNERVV